jgi:hypothetical protein
MSQKLPTGNYKWEDQRVINTFQVNDIPDNADRGCILMCDIQYPSKLHDLHNDYPLALKTLKSLKICYLLTIRMLLKQINNNISLLQN